MTNDEAIEKLRRIAQRIWLAPLEHKAMHLAIKALEKEQRNDNQRSDN